MSPSEFRATVTALGFNIERIGLQIGMGRRQMTRYASGDSKIPLYVELALEGLRFRSKMGGLK